MPNELKDRKLRVIIFARVSTDKQELTGLSMEDQEERGIDYCKKYNYPYLVIREPGISGKLAHTERDGLKNLLSKTLRTYDIKTQEYEQEYNAVFVTEYERISRNEIDAPFIKLHLAQNKITLIENGNIIDISDLNQSLLISLKGFLAHYEREKIRERVQRALERSASIGRAKGGPILNYGYTKNDNKLMIIDEIEADIVRKIFAWSKEGHGTKVIANKLNELKIPTKRSRSSNGQMKVRGKTINSFVWRDAVVYGILTNPVYIGIRIHKGKTYKCPEIIEKDEFEITQQRLSKNNAFKNTTNKHFYLLKGLILCGNCGQSFYGHKRADLSDNQYICHSQRYGNFCKNRGIGIERLNKIVWSLLLDLPNNINKLVIEENTSYVNDLIKKISVYKDKLIKLFLKKDKLVQLILRNPSIEKNLESDLVKISNTIDTTTQQIERMERELHMSSSHGDLVGFLNNQLSPYVNSEVNDLEKQTIIRAFVEMIIVKWNSAINNHIVCVEFKISKLSDLSVQGIGTVKYRKMGWSFREQNISYGFRIINPEIKVVEKSDGTISIKEINPHKTTHGFQVNDDSFSSDNMMNLRHIMSSKRKSK
jgi:DNA invertase Pin-like site-specific DNA recombinase